MVEDGIFPPKFNKLILMSSYILLACLLIGAIVGSIIGFNILPLMMSIAILVIVIMVIYLWLSDKKK